MKLFFTIIFHMMIVQQAIFAQCSTIKKIADINDCISDVLKKENPENILVIFDLENSLIQPKKDAKQIKGIASCDVQSSSLTSKEKELANTHAIYGRRLSLIEKESPLRIRDLKKRGVKIIGYTSVLVNPSQQTKNKMLFKFRESLQKIGLNFTAHGLPTKVKPLNNLPRYFHDVPTFYHGLLCVNGKYNKAIDDGRVLVEFLRSLTHSKMGCPTSQPKTIVFVSSAIDTINNIEKQLSSLQPSINFIGIQYLN
ncbi:MAG: hypothetical protein COY39_02265 [Alphaproteobacteria bacterium CG_4_10_14_0_8_um_filter_37_21]|nr:MAG: hypothetical protein COY39_02265 [Alphaproteobacteria bacterium CG_4_10_14_0_8_um_filter_37_21]